MSYIKLGKYNQLEVVKEVDFGVYLDGDEDGEILLPQRYVPEGTTPGDMLNVFIYLWMNDWWLPRFSLMCRWASSLALKWHG